MPSPTPERTWTIAQVAAEFGVTHRTIRHYEDIGLITPERHGTQRIFHRRDRTRLNLILRGKRLGFPLEEIRTIIDLYDAPRGQRSQLEYVMAQIDEGVGQMGDHPFGPPVQFRRDGLVQRRDLGDLHDGVSRPGMLGRGSNVFAGAKFLQPSRFRKRFLSLTAKLAGAAYIVARISVRRASIDLKPWSVLKRQ